MKKLSAFFVFLASMQLYGMEGENPQALAAPAPLAVPIIARNSDDFVASIDNEHNAQIRYFTERYFPESVIWKFGEKQIKPDQKKIIQESLILDFTLGTKINDHRSLDLTPLVKTILENGYIENYHKELSKHPLIVPHIRAKELEFQQKITIWNDRMEQAKVGAEFLVTELETQPILPQDLHAWQLQLKSQEALLEKKRILLNNHVETLKLRKNYFDEEKLSYKRFLPSSAWFKYPAVIGLSVLFSEQIKYGLWEAVRQAPMIWAKYFSRVSATAAK